MYIKAQIKKEIYIFELQNPTTIYLVYIQCNFLLKI
jgi:hypothetical protein